jgi:hypothetical protein
MASESPPSEIDSIATSQNIHLENHVKAFSSLSEYVQKLREDLTQLQEIKSHQSRKRRGLWI